MRVLERGLAGLAAAVVAAGVVPVAAAATAEPKVAWTHQFGSSERAQVEATP